MTSELRFRVDSWLWFRFWMRSNPRDLTWNVVIALTGRRIGIVRAPTHEQALGRAILLAAQTDYEPGRLVVTRYLHENENVGPMRVQKGYGRGRLACPRRR